MGYRDDSYLYKNQIPEHSGHPSQVLDQVHFSSQAKLLRAHHDLHTVCPSGATNKYVVSTFYGRTRCVYVLPYTQILARALRTPGTFLRPLALLLPAGRIVHAPKLATCSDCESKFLLQHANAKQSIEQTFQWLLRCRRCSLFRWWCICFRD